MYNRIKNPTGVVRDHKLSICEGFKNYIDSEIMSHPANCEFLSHIENSRKSRLSSVNIEQLLDDIELWNARLAQWVEATDRGSVQCEFDSHIEYRLTFSIKML